MISRCRFLLSKYVIYYYEKCFPNIITETDPVFLFYRLLLAIPSESIIMQKQTCYYLKRIFWN